MLHSDDSNLIQEIDNECRWLQEQLQGRRRSLARDIGQKRFDLRQGGYTIVSRCRFIACAPEN